MEKRRPVQFERRCGVHERAFEARSVEWGKTKNSLTSVFGFGVCSHRFDSGRQRAASSVRWKNVDSCGTDDSTKSSFLRGSTTFLSGVYE